MKWEKAPEELKETLARGVEGIECQKRLMFGYPAYFINGNMFAGLFQSSVFLRLSDEAAAALKKRHPSVAPLEPMPGRPMKGYVVLPQAIYGKEDAFKAVCRDAAEYTRTLVPKAKKVTQSKKKAAKN
jgi:TfoX/Sxy family transcriptional regulator of competence genes